uniref:Thioredoxin domain-containing protein n=2 Tax=Schistosoma mansoni TaxID=6183 RepID=A0A3Q0KQU4_SCHMA
MYISKKLGFLQLIIILLSVLKFSTGFMRNRINATVEEVDNNTLYQILSVQRHVVVYFYDHGHQQESIYKLVNGTSYKVDETMLPISVVTVCATFYDEMEKKLNIYIPSVTYFRDGGKYKSEYKELMKINGNHGNPLYEWIKLKIGSPIKLLRSMNETNEFIITNNLIAIIFMKDFDEKIMKNISTVAEQADHIAYGLVYNETIFDHFKITNQSLLLIRKESEDTEPFHLIYSGDWNIESLGSYLFIESLPIVNEFKIGELTYFDSATIKHDVYLFLIQSDFEFPLALNNYRNACKLFRKEIRCYFVDTANEINLKFSQQHGVHVGYGYPRFQLVATSKKGSRIRYRLKGPKFEFGRKGFNNRDLMNMIETQDIINFFDQLLQRKLSPFYMSEIVPEYDENASDDIENIGHIPLSSMIKTPPLKLKFIHKVVGATFKTLVKNPEWTSVVYFTAKWCMGCNRTIHEEFTKLSQYYQEHRRNDLLFGYSYFDLNDYEELTATKMPRIKIFPKQSNEQIDYEGKEHFDDIKEFIETVERTVK